MFYKQLSSYALLAMLIIALLSSTNVCTAKGKPVKTPPPNAAPKQLLNIAYLSQPYSPPANVSTLEPFISNQGESGAALAITDNNTTGAFLGQQFVLQRFIVPENGDVMATFQQQIAGKFYAVVLNLPAKQLQQVADHTAAKSMLLFDVRSSDDALRGEQCRVNVLHLLPSRAMRADALAQYMAKKRWTKWFLVVGASEEDRLLAASLHRAAKKFAMTIVEEKSWQHDFANRHNAQAEIAAFSQVDDYDVLVVADEQGLFGDYVDYRTWLPRPVIGTHGLTASAWHKTHEQWGASQLQKRFLQSAGRFMEEPDYGAYLAVRAIGEAASRHQATDAQTLKQFLLSEKFALQGYKGNPLSFRAWDGQLRQPILLAGSRAMVAVAPIEGFLHQRTELDTLGYDAPESECKAMQ